MGTWKKPETWKQYLSKAGCPVCNQTPDTRPPTETAIADLSVSRFIADRNTCMKGHCCLVLKPHVIELYDLSDAEAAAFMRDAKAVSLALKRVTGAVKINYEIHGNTIPHMHMHLWPRQIGDRFEGGPIDWRTRTPDTYADGEFEAFVGAMRSAVGKETS
jgi:diadenosine tetraphosphate (Ap4A) HIT family hydrolase